ncbi:hypothetical protein GCM10007852_07980 [Agaribacter marinus]|uniref:PAS domain-containing protein n=1 Tax=Agaribacter marinus TaxID=1431249 RepID=A0AA37WJK4_9ALTE|nr:PAS domain-containing protein [Agaribacter marinus]GLR69890.1 hypothetical protein GCM10007852_07980 [Agaribacter marinus]
MRRNQITLNNEVFFDENQELTSTNDTRGVITYANDAFCEVAGYSKQELEGNNHNIVRHPDMPKAAFKDMWTHLQARESWQGIVKNRCKVGSYYWVDKMRQSRNDANKSASQAEQSAESIQQIYSMIETVSTHLNDIVDSAESQDGKCKEIDGAVSNMLETTNSSAELAEEMEDNARILTGNIRRLVGMSNTFSVK